ncbi:MAG: ribosome biogenesis GTPase YlqF [Firmicutes bacterium]|nr:ribosome biogenesis GTPase YlqF [Bacillota bacterium]
MQMIQWYPGHMAKAKRNIESDLALVDMIIEVIDARIPAASRNPDLQPYLGRKAHVLLLNKADLADPQLTQRWLAAYRRRGYYPAAVNAARKQGVRALIAAVEKSAQPVYQKLAAKGRLPRGVRAMVLGIPNCGKSTVINALAPAAAAKTGNKPGVTKGKQWVKTRAGIELLDTPGLLWPKFASDDTAFKLAVCGSISDLVFPVYQVARQLAELLLQIDAPALCLRYKLKQAPEDGDAFFADMAAARGLLGPGGRLRTEDAASVFLQEFRSGKLGRFTLEKPEEALDG